MQFKQFLEEKNKPIIISEEVTKDVLSLLEDLSKLKDLEEAKTTFYTIFEVLKPTADVLGINLNIQEDDED